MFQVSESIFITGFPFATTFLPIIEVETEKDEEFPITIHCEFFLGQTPIYGNEKALRAKAINILDAYVLELTWKLEVEIRKFATKPINKYTLQHVGGMVNGNHYVIALTIGGLFETGNWLEDGF